MASVHATIPDICGQQTSHSPQLLAIDIHTELFTCLVPLQALCKQISVLHHLLGSSGAVAALVADAMGNSAEVACLSHQDREMLLKWAVQDQGIGDGRLCNYPKLFGVAAMPDDLAGEREVHIALSHCTHVTSDHNTGHLWLHTVGPRMPHMLSPSQQNRCMISSLGMQA